MSQDRSTELREDAQVNLNTIIVDKEKEFGKDIVAAANYFRQAWNSEQPHAIRHAIDLLKKELINKGYKEGHETYAVFDKKVFQVANDFCDQTELKSRMPNVPTGQPRAQQNKNASQAPVVRNTQGYPSKYGPPNPALSDSKVFESVQKIIHTMNNVLNKDVRNKENQRQFESSLNVAIIKLEALNKRGTANISTIRGYTEQLEALNKRYQKAMETNQSRPKPP